MAEVIDVTTDPTTHTATLGEDVPLDYTPAPGVGRIVGIMVSTANPNPDNGGGAVIYVNGLPLDTPLTIGAAGNFFATTMVAVAIDDAHSGPLDLKFVSSLGDEAPATDYEYRMQYFTAQNVNPEDASLEFGSFVNSIAANPIEADSSGPATVDDLFFAVGMWMTSSSLAVPAMTPGDLTAQDELYISAALNGQIGAGAVMGYATGLTGEQDVVFGPGGSGVGPYGLGTFVLRHLDASCADVTGFNCEVFPDNDNKTLAEYRQKLLIRAGFAAVASNPPPGTAALFNSFLEDAQNFLYKKYPALETRWIFRWALEENVRFYGLRDSDDTSQNCVHLDAYKNIEGAWLIDLNGQWLPMACGIPPSFYTTVNNPTLPFRYEIRQCLEIFPAPPAPGYYVAIKGHFGMQPFDEDTDKPTIDGELVYLWALANALDYYGKPAAAGIATQANDYLGQLVAGTHTGKRYIPGTRPANPAIMPVYVPWPGEY